MRDESIKKILPKRIRRQFEINNYNLEDLMEIRMRVNEPVMIKDETGSRYLTDDKEKELVINEAEIKEATEYITHYSLYAYADEIKQGFITIEGGHRVGVAGRVVLDEGKVKSIKNITFINIRISHEVKGCATKVMPYILDEGRVKDTLIISPPGYGKTTMLRDIIRMLSDGYETVTGRNVGIVDERSEIAACYMGIPQNDIGERTDILDCCPKAEGMLMLIRSMTPDVICVDEIGGSKDIEAISYVMNSGCSLIATVHGNSIDDIRNKPLLGKLVLERTFTRYIVLGNKNGIGSIESVFDERGNDLL